MTTTCGDIALVVAMVVGMIACGRQTPASNETAAGDRHALTGVVVGTDGRDGAVTIAHDAVQGVMPAMAMSFPVRGPRPDLRVDDQISATLVVTADASWLEDVVVTRPAATARAVAAAPSAVVGTHLPDFHLRNQDDQPVRMQDLRGRAVLVTFIYTRCPLPDYCPRLMRHLDAVKQAIDALPDVRTRVHLVAVSVDPAFDTPVVLRAYGERYISGPRKFSHLDLATGTATEVQAMAGFFGVNYVDERGQISHALATAVIGADGRVVSVFRGNSWQPDDAIAVLVSEARKTG